MAEIVYPDLPQDVDLEYHPDLYQFWEDEDALHEAGWEGDEE